MADICTQHCHILRRVYWLNTHVQPFLRRLITRLIGLVPSMVVAIAVGRPGINMLLVASQVALSVVLPFVVFPLIWLTSSKSIMRVRVPRSADEKARREPSSQEESLPPAPEPSEMLVSEDSTEVHMPRSSAACVGGLADARISDRNCRYTPGQTRRQSGRGSYYTARRGWVHRLQQRTRTFCPCDSYIYHHYCS